MKLLLEIIEQAFFGGSEFLGGGVDELFKKKSKLLEAKFGNEYELLSRYNQGFALGTKRFTTLQSRQNLLLFAASGVGKTSVCLIPSAISVCTSKLGASMIINDPSGELSVLVYLLLKNGYTVLKFDPNDPKKSIYYNPLTRIKNKSDIQKIARMLVKKSTKELDFWAVKAIELIALIIEFLIDHAPKVNQNLANVYYLLQNLAGNEDVINGLFIEKATEQQWIAFKSVIANSPNTKASIVSSALSNLSWLGSDPVLCDLTSVDTFNVSHMRIEKTVLFLNCPLNDMEHYSVLLGLFFEQVFTEVFSSLPQEEDKDIYLLIDELSTIPLPNLASVISNARKFKMPILGVLQSENQLYENYGQYNAKTIINNACRVYMTGLTDECERLEKTLGTFQYYEDKDKKVVRSRPLMTSDEIRTMPQNRVIVLPNGGMRPLFVKVKPYYKIPKYLRFLKTEAPEDYMPLQSADYKVQYLSLEKYKNQ
ncbi:type IV secretory system conjugative DNA transfer family protein [Gilvibacter sediminis]|uniref:type IV secretory system conjugative DNA transfer family protein n=1 Tax=Gilvibacter sediminis TaxID=379071 RepID=UPI0023507CD0|nr:type IV secretory system conjugative DNA transfer family protein [Gilvibacter sediminis]MDC7996911.1 type IV secretory system conjugative DNA transfer family protein [Gilvibacter sediminis]